tara:strand:- start:303 stop:689 length:387 start_codon:yes stop_codon:yes gene_type:complete
MKLVAIVDSVGRVILGRHDVQASTKAQLNLRNPAVVNIQVDQQSGQISVQLIPYIFREFVRAEKRADGVSWNFQKQSITTSNDLHLEDNILDQYTKIFESIDVDQGEIVEEIKEPDTVQPVELFDEVK